MSSNPRIGNNSHVTFRFPMLSRHLVGLLLQMSAVLALYKPSSPDSNPLRSVVLRNAIDDVNNFNSSWVVPALPLDSNDAIALPPLTFVNRSQTFYFSFTLLQLQNSRFLIAFASHPLLSIALFRRVPPTNSSNIIFASTTRYGSVSVAHGTDVGAPASTYASIYVDAIGSCSSSCPLIMAVSLLSQPNLDNVSLSDNNNQAWQGPAGSSFNITFPFQATITGARGYIMPMSGLISGQLQVGQSDYWSLTIPASWLPVQVTSFANPSVSVKSCIMDLYFMARPHLAYYPANGAAHTLTYTNEVALLSTNSTPAAVPGTYIIKMSSLNWVAQFPSMTVLYYYIQAVTPGSSSGSSSGSGSGSGSGNYNPYYPSSGSSGQPSSSESGFGSTTIIIALCSIAFVILFYFFLAWCRHRAMRIMQEQLENNVVNNVVMMFAGPGGAMRRGCSQQEIDELPLKEFQLGMFPPEDAVCSICLTEYSERESLRTLPCAHHFHQSCLDPWLLQSQLCPLCHQNIEGARDVHAPSSPIAVAPLSSAPPPYSGASQAFLMPPPPPSVGSEGIELTQNRLFEPAAAPAPPLPPVIGAK